MRKRIPRLDLLEACLVAGLVGLFGFMVGRQYTGKQLQPYLSAGTAELRPLVQRFGRDKNSEHGEEWIIRDYFGDTRNGVFVDVGASHYQRNSNTHYLETKLGWRGIAVEPQTKFAADYARHRPKTIFVPLFVSDKSDDLVTMYVPDNDLIASANKSFVEQEGGKDVKEVPVQTATLNDILTRHAIDRIDFLSLDVELHEPEVLRGFSIHRFNPRLVCVEAHAPVRQQILDHFAAHDYALLGKYLRADPENLWFAPRERP
jgi:FkbM family methyltransferase